MTSYLIDAHTLASYVALEPWEDPEALEPLLPLVPQELAPALQGQMSGTALGDLFVRPGFSMEVDKMGLALWWRLLCLQRPKAALSNHVGRRVAASLTNEPDLALLAFAGPALTKVGRDLDNILWSSLVDLGGLGMLRRWVPQGTGLLLTSGQAAVFWNSLSFWKKYFAGDGEPWRTVVRDLVAQQGAHLAAFVAHGGPAVLGDVLEAFPEFTEVLTQHLDTAATVEVLL